MSMETSFTSTIVGTEFAIRSINARWDVMVILMSRSHHEIVSAQCHLDVSIPGSNPLTLFSQTTQ